MIELSDSESSSDEECNVQVKSEVDVFGEGSSSVATTSRRLIERGQSSSRHSQETGYPFVKSEVGEFDEGLPSGTTSRRPVEVNPPTSSQRHNLRQYFIGMGFSPALVDRVLRENDGDNVELLLESLFEYSAPQNVKSEPAGSSDRISSPITDDSDFSLDGAEMEELEVKSEFIEDTRAYLLTMSFSVKEVDSAIERLGEHAPVNELVDYIVATQIAEGAAKNEEATTASLFATMDRTLLLLEMGFTEEEISFALEKYGGDISVQELADSIVAKQNGDTWVVKTEEESTSDVMHHSHSENGWRPFESSTNHHDDSVSRSQTGNGWTTIESLSRGTIRRPYESLTDHHDDSRSRSQTGNGWTTVESLSKESIRRRAVETSMSQNYASSSSFNPYAEYTDSKESVKGKRPKIESTEPISISESFDDYKVPISSHSTAHSRRLLESVAKPPYFFYGNVLAISNSTWVRITQFLYGVAQEFVNTEFFSALSRKEGYVHNLPTENRSHILPKTAMTIEGVMAHTKPWWPSWDTRKHLSWINPEATGIYQLCERLGRILADTRGVPSKIQQSEIIHHCKTLNLVWTGKNKLSPIDPEYIEQILGYPANHTDIMRYDPAERLKLLKYSFQTDTLGYHLSALKSIYPHGLNMLSIYSGIGGVEVALHRLGVRLKCVVSVEDSETNRRILKRWWDNTRQTGKLVQIEGIGKMTSSRIECLTKEYGGFDFVVCQNPCALMSGSSNGAVDVDLDTNMFFEFVRVLQRVRGSAGSNR
ncbi:probable inactive DNA (cytosine-5)-methyltransferase DRM3 isoform X2 [Papaver somniferum]|uniref:probable inactive DNA (cytosine-5)-methyltransferase DRM3 isoform X2 n=1 Tax=Papaver somniferum TaxID=3469 RepID=UPI000E6FDB36|nr:probable inactive DNA (cytosine-5)-methyltransferase DRM3 isoform X2 [Papaver somniferum]